MLMPFDELDSLMKQYLNPTVYSNMCEILDNIRTKVNCYLIVRHNEFYFS